MYHVIYLSYEPMINALTNCSRLLLLSKLVFTTVLNCNGVGWGLMCTVQITLCELIAGIIPIGQISS
jgi:hypothetical protein